MEEIGWLMFGSDWSSAEVDILADLRRQYPDSNKVEIGQQFKSRFSWGSEEDLKKDELPTAGKELAVPPKNQHHEQEKCDVLTTADTGPSVLHSVVIWVWRPEYSFSTECSSEDSV